MFSSTVSALQKYPCGILCDGRDNLDTNLKARAERTNQFQLLGKLISQAADVHVGDTYYHLQWYLHLRDLTRAKDREYMQALLSLSPIRLPLHKLLL